MDQRTLRQWLLLSRVTGLGFSCFSKLTRDGSPASVISASNHELERSGLRKPGRDQILAYRDSPDEHPLAEQISKDLLWLNEENHHLIPISSDAYPPLLKDIPSPPIVLYCVGDPDCLLWPQLAMVGSRNPSASGRELAESFAKSLGQSGILITSGLALGVDAAAHQGALTAGQPTIAVVGTGLDRVYPSKNHELAKKIVENGVMVSEFPLGTPPRAQNFPRRNRIISGLSLGVLVVEAALKSGSLITAKYAMEQGREVFAIPGSIHNPMSKGCHSIIRQGAKLVETTAHILEDLGPLAMQMGKVLIEESPNAAPESVITLHAESLSDDQKLCLQHLDHAPASVDQLVERSGLPVHRVSGCLLDMELQGWLESDGSHFWLRSVLPK